MANEKSGLADAFANTRIVSKPGAEIRVERTELTGVLRERLTTSVRSLGSSSSPRATDVKSRN
ncbi:hypothetical protein [Longimicrobium sp.]|jgi:hypothetical protein|uniref:hypothetical protein n=1 Tax=Longimicrobium sp. TaxID=2029185 RepID=UPI002F935CF0